MEEEVAVMEVEPEMTIRPEVAVMEPEVAVTEPEITMTMTMTMAALDGRRNQNLSITNQALLEDPENQRMNLMIIMHMHRMKLHTMGVTNIPR